MSQPPGSLTMSPQAQAARLCGILESAVTAIVTIEERGIIESVNPATERLFGYGSEELVGNNVKILMPEPYRSEHDGTLAATSPPASGRSSASVARSAVGARTAGVSAAFV